MNTISKIFGGKPKEPTLVKQPEPVEKIQQESNIEKDKVYREYAKRRRATVLAELSRANVKREKLGPG